MSLLTIVSRHHQYRSHNSVTLHHSAVLDRQLPAPPQHEIHNEHGTRVSVRNLFGNLPVRVKQRAVLAEQKVEHNRLWDNLKREVVGILLSCRRQVSLRLRDADGKTSLSLANTTPTTNVGKVRLSGLQSMLNVLTQANYISIDEWVSWVPVAASTAKISIKGAISLNPAPSKRVQFISLGIRPVSSESGHNELYDEVNRIFSLSSFGSVDDDVNIDEKEIARRRSDKRFKNEGYTNRQLKARKGVDRYPMFHLRISLDHDSGSLVSEDFFHDETKMSSLLEVLNAMVTQWLSVHHFRPRKLRTRQDRMTAASTAEDTDVKCVSESDVRPRQRNRRFHSEMSPLPADGSDLTSNQGKKKPRPFTTEQITERPQYRAFTAWTRIKSARPEFFDSSTIGGKHNASQASSHISGSPTLTAPQPGAVDSAEFDAHPVLPGSLDCVNPPRAAVDEESSSEEGKCDDTVTWVEPTTKQTFLLNARTGCVVPHPPKGQRSDTFNSSHQTTLSEFNKPLRLQSKPRSSDGETHPWLRGMLDKWDDPVFKPVEKGIQQILLHDHQFDHHDSSHKNCTGSSVHQNDATYNRSFIASANKLSKTGLRNAQVLAQLDKKFILVKMCNSTNVPSDSHQLVDVLVLIDQHAADERVRVEKLFTELCTPLPKKHIHSEYRSQLGHRSHVAFTILEKPIQFAVSFHEREEFVAHATRFAAWGVLFDIVSPAGTSARLQSVLAVVTLPPVISERCKADPQVLITFLRSTVWKYADDPPSSTQGNGNNEDAIPWTRRLSTCPEGLIDLVNSRACRSAIMFNDDLTMSECKSLIQKLSQCVFPFTCAHGRPSMVPLVDLGMAGETACSSLGFESPGKGSSTSEGFVTAWKAWKQR